MADGEGVAQTRDGEELCVVRPERWRDVERAFERVLEAPAAERTTALDIACGADEELRCEVESLLAAHMESGDFIDRPDLFFSTEALGAADSALAPGERVGPYRVVRELGRGGMGAVYLAERADSQFEKRVAVKLIKRGMDTDAVLRHFRNERQILAGFEHPNIARLLDGGTTEAGLPFFVMEYVEGEPLDQYCDAHALNVTERVKLFREICSAVAYAHRHLVVHRDIKPSNVLVAADGTPKLLDFGVAKILQPGGADAAATATALERRAMTPGYASPEQARGLPITTASDVYSLGVILYELLTGRPPYRFQSRAPEDIARTIGETSPPPPSTVVGGGDIAAGAGARIEESDAASTSAESISRTREGSPERLRRRLRGDLDNVVLMALRKEPGRRYSSVEHFSEDLRRHLEGEPVLARGDAPSYRVAKFVRRNKTAVAAATLIFLSLVFGVAATAWQARKARAAQARAERRFNDVRQLANAALFDYHDAIRDLPGATPVRMRLVRDALRYLDSLAAESGGDPALQRELAAAYDRVGDVAGGRAHANLGDTDAATQSYEKALRIREALAEADPLDAQNRRELARSYRKVGYHLLDTKDAARGMESLNRSLAMLTELAAERPSDVETHRELAEAYNDVGMGLEAQGDMMGALESHRRALALREEFAKTEPEHRQFRRDLSVTYENMGRALFLSDDVRGALESNGRALELREALLREDPANAEYRRLLAISYQNNGDYRAWLEDTFGALESFRKKLSIDEQLLAADPANARARDDLGYSSQRIGDLLYESGDYPASLPHYRKAVEMREKSALAAPGDLLPRIVLSVARAALGRAHARSGGYAQAREACSQSLAILRETADVAANAEQNRLRILAYTTLGEAYATLAADRRSPPDATKAHWRAARDMYRHALEIMKDLQERGVLDAGETTEIEEVARKIAVCDVALGN